jgi:5,10-methylenetetrahydromethanopterin reductase
VFVSMTAAAMQTSKIRLATGVLIPSNRIAPVTASALATLNAIAPGRIDFGVSTGFTARRTLGLGKVKQADMEEYIRVVKGLLAGETLEWKVENAKDELRRKIRFLDPDIGAINIKDEIPVHVSAFGPKGRQLTARVGAGWLNSGTHLERAKAGLEDMRVQWQAVGRDPAKLHISATVAGCVLQPGESPDSARVKAFVGAHATVALHSLVEQEEYGAGWRAVPPVMEPLIAKYREAFLQYQPPDARYLTNHRGHLMYLKPEEEALCTGELIQATTWTAPKAELRERVRALRDMGYQHFGINAAFGTKNAITQLEQWADVFEGV